METEHIPDEQAQKKGRHRRRQLYNSILQQMEFYFSDSNLSKDRMLGQLTADDPFVDVSIFLQFNKIRKLTTNIDEITKAISKSELIELSEDKTKVRRKLPLKVKENIEECTIYVERLKSDATHEWLTTIFSEFGNVVYVSIPKYKHSQMIKGFAFVEFENEEGPKAALEYFESIDCKIPSYIEPQKLLSIASYEGEKKNKLGDNFSQENGENHGDEPKHKTKKRKHSLEEKDEVVENVAVTKEIVKIDEQEKTTSKDQSQSEKKRKANDEMQEDINDINNKKVKLVDENAVGKQEIIVKIEEQETTSNEKRKASEEMQVEPILQDVMEENKTKVILEAVIETNIVIQPDPMSEAEGEEKKKKKQKKSHRKKLNLKEIGLQILAKREWKKMRNRYLGMQRKTMKELKMHLNMQKYSSRSEAHRKPCYREEPPLEVEVVPDDNVKEQFTAGLIVKISLPEACMDNKKLKNEIKASSSDVQFVDIPLPAGSEEVYVRFAEAGHAQNFCTSNTKGKCSVLEGEEETEYWKKIEASRNAKQKRSGAKLRGRDKLLKKAEKQISKHVRFDDSE